MPLVDYQNLTTSLVRDDTGRIVNADRDEAIARAVARYSKDRPRLKKQDIAADAQNKISLPSGWEADFSQLRSIEFPVGDVPPQYLAQDRIGLYDELGTQKIMLLEAVNIGATLRVEYTSAHVVSGVTDSIASDDREPVCCWAAALLLDQLASFYSGVSDSTIQADAVEHGSKAREYRNRAKDLRARYFAELGQEEKKSVPAGVMVNLDQSDSIGQDRLTHPRRYR